MFVSSPPKPIATSDLQLIIEQEARPRDKQCPIARARFAACSTTYPTCS